MEIVLAIICACLLALFLIFLGKYLHIKREIRSFSEEVSKLQSRDYKQPVKVTTFDKDIVALANAVNAHVDIQKALGEEYIGERKKLSDVISGISHDFRTPLTASLGYLQMIRKSGGLSGENLEYLEIAAEKNEFLKKLSDDFFEATKLSEGGKEAETEIINLSNAVSAAVLEQYGWIEKRNIKTEFSVPDGIFAAAELHMINRILENLFSNAEKYTFSKLGVSLEKVGEKAVLKTFNDVACGEVIETDKIFDAFYRGGSRTNKGSGLGLYVVKCLSDKLGAEVGAEFENGVFVISLKFRCAD